MQDFRGLEIIKGDLIAYPVRKQSNMWMNLATVKAIHLDHVEAINSDQRTVRVTQNERIAVLGR